MKYLVVDAELGGTGIRDYYEGDYLNPRDFQLDEELIVRLEKWLIRYEQEHYKSFCDPIINATLDREGLEIATQINRQISDAKIDYYSAAKLTKIIVP